MPDLPLHNFANLPQTTLIGWMTEDQVAGFFAIPKTLIPFYIEKGLPPPLRATNKTRVWPGEKVLEFHNKLLSGEISLEAKPSKRWVR